MQQISITSYRCSQSAKWIRFPNPALVPFFTLAMQTGRGLNVAQPVLLASSRPPEALQFMLHTCFQEPAPPWSSMAVTQTGWPSTPQAGQGGAVSLLTWPRDASHSKPIGCHVLQRPALLQGRFGAPCLSLSWFPNLGSSRILKASMVYLLTWVL